MRVKSITLAAVAAAMMIWSAPASASPISDRVFERLYNIENRIDHLRDIRDPHARLERVDRLQHRLGRLEYRVDRKRGKRARHASEWIDTLQSRLHRIERRTKHRLARKSQKRHGFRDRHLSFSKNGQDPVYFGHFPRSIVIYDREYSRSKY